jgi:micrococcal nuclease
MMALALVLALLAVAAPAGAQGRLGYVTRAVDGDTVYVELGGRIEPVQYLGLVVPLVNHPLRGPDAYAAVTREMNRRLVEGKWVRLAYERQARDADGRLLAYVWVGNLFVNAALLHWGYAEAAPPAPDVRYADYFRGLEAGARRDGRGLWGDAGVLQYHRRGGLASADTSDPHQRPASASGGRVFSAPNPFLPVLSAPSGTSTSSSVSTGPPVGLPLPPSSGYAPRTGTPIRR